MSVLLKNSVFPKIVFVAFWLKHCENVHRNIFVHVRKLIYINMALLFEATDISKCHIVAFEQEIESVMMSIHRYFQH